MTTNNQIDKDILRTFLIFEATMISITTIIDKGWKHNTKVYFKLWYKEGKRLWKELLKNIDNLKNSEEGANYYDEASAYLYEVCDYSLNKIDDTRKEEFLKYIKEFK